MRKQIASLESLGVIERSTSSEYSQKHLVRKPDDSWRLCIVFKNLNEATESLETWPLQNIPIMIDRVTRHRPRFYGKMDITSGFFQTAIDAKSRPFTAFITSSGLYQWCRLPMGLKGAASYFQRMMDSIVLAGLLYITVEPYLGDVLVYATTEEEFTERLDKLFQRFRQHNITLNPKKYAFGMEKVEFVGHILKVDGVHFSAEKRGKVLDFLLPRKQKQLKSFLGLVNYFRDHVENSSVLSVPLNDMTIPYKKSGTVVWAPQLEERFRVIQEAVGNCPKLYYVDLNLPIRTHRIMG
jgi:hypothetical protein